MGAQRDSLDGTAAVRGRRRRAVASVIRRLLSRPQPLFIAVAITKDDNARRCKVGKPEERADLGRGATDYQGLTQALEPELEYGTWLIVNNLAARFAMHRPGGWHPWVLVQPSDATRPSSVAYPRSTSSDEGIRAPAAPAPASRCRLTEAARIVLRREAVPANAVSSSPADVECVEPDPDALRASFKSRRR